MSQNQNLLKFYVLIVAILGIAGLIITFLFLQGIYRTIFAFIFSLIIIIVVAYYYMNREKKEQLPILARSIGTYQINQFKGLDSFRGVTVRSSHPLHDSQGRTSGYFDLKLVKEGGEDSGFMIVNADRTDDPVLFFTLEGPSLREHFQQVIGHSDFKVVWLTPTYSYAVNEEGEILAKLGDYNPDEEILAQLGDGEFNYGRFHDLIWERVQADKRAEADLVKAAWQELPAGGKKSSDLVRNDSPSGNWFEYRVEGHSWAAELRQIPPNRGENDNDFNAGCGPVAWATYLAWHDLVWTPELLRGSQDENGTSYGSILSPNHEEQWECYLDRVIMDFVDLLETYAKNEGGWTKDNKMDNGFNYISTLGYQISGRDEDSGKTETVQKVKDCSVGFYTLARGYETRPVLVKTPSHFCVSAGFVENLDKRRAVNAHFVYLKTGWSNPKTGYIKSKYLEKYWYFKDILLSSGQRIKYNETSPHSPVLISTRDPRRDGQPDEALQDMLWIFWLEDLPPYSGQNGIIYHTIGRDGHIPDMGNKQSLNRAAKYQPAVTSSGYDILLAYVDLADKIKILRWESKSDSWSEIQFPDIVTTVKPTIVMQGEWLCVAYNDPEDDSVKIIATRKDLKRPNAWPSQYPINEADWYWTLLDFAGTESGLESTKLSDRGSSYINEKVLIVWKHTRPIELSYDRAHLPRYHFGVLKNDGTQSNFLLYDVTDRYYETPTFTNYNHTVYAAYRSIARAIHIDHIRGRHINAYDYEVASTPLESSAHILEECKGRPSMAFVETNNGDEPRMAICWLDKTNHIRLRYLSIDDDYFPISYENHPV